MGRDGAQLPRPLDVEHLVVEVDVRLDLLQQGPFGGPGQEEGLVDLQPPGPQGLEHAGPAAGGAAGRHQVGADGTVHALVLGVELPLQLAEGLQETLQGPLVDKHCKFNTVNIYR